jgi:hypothetical protein
VSGETEVDEAELMRVLRLYEGPAQPQSYTRSASHVRALAVVALILAAVAIAAFAAFVAGGKEERTHDALPAGACTATLLFGGTRYVAHTLEAARGIEFGRALGRGVLHPCGGPAASSTVTAIAGVDVERAIAVERRQTVIYVTPACARAASAQLLACLRGSP